MKCDAFIRGSKIHIHCIKMCIHVTKFSCVQSSLQGLAFSYLQASLMLNNYAKVKS